VLRFPLGGEVEARTSAGVSAATVDGLVDVDPRLRWAPLGYALPVLQEAPALRVVPGALSFTHVHGQPQPELRRIAARVEVDPAAALATIEIDESLSGYAALEWRDALEKAAFERLRSELEQRSLGFFFPGVSLLDLRVAEREQPSRPLAVHLRIRAPRLVARRQDGELAMRSVLIPSLLGRRYVGLASRAMTLMVGYVPAMEEHVTLKLPPGSRAELPPDVALATPFGKLERRCRLTAGGGQVRIDSRLEVRMQRVAPADYPAFVRFARAVDEAEAAELRILLATPPSPR
jgi:hypothetical protein